MKKPVKNYTNEGELEDEDEIIEMENQKDN